MMWICPICNGFDSLIQPCPRCHRPLEDMGRLSDYYNPYSPYREIDQLKLTNGYQDLTHHLCFHLLSCPQCHLQLVHHVQEQEYQGQHE